MTQEEKDERIAELEKELAELKETPVSRGWQPRLREYFYYIGSDDDIYEIHWTNSDGDEFKYAINNCFKTREEAEERRKEIETYYNFKNYVEENSEPLDCKESSSPKYFCEYNHATHRIEVDFNIVCQVQGVIYASSEEILRDAIEHIGGEEVAKRYLFGIKE